MESRSWLLSALLKTVAQLGECPPHVWEIVRHHKRSKLVDLQQVCRRTSG